VAVRNFIQVYQNAKAFPSGCSCQIRNIQAPNFTLIFLLATVYYIFFANIVTIRVQEREFSGKQIPQK